MSLEAGRGSNTFISAGPIHSSAAVVIPLIAPHLISDIVTTVAVRVTAEKCRCVFDKMTSPPAPVVSNQRSLPTPKIGVTVHRSVALGSPLRSSPLRSAPLSHHRFCWYTMEALSAQTRTTVNTDSTGGEKPGLRCDSQITHNYIFPILEFLVFIFSNQ